MSGPIKLSFSLTSNNGNLTTSLERLLKSSRLCQDKDRCPPQHQQQLHHHCGGLYKYTCLEMHIAAQTWYVKH